MAYLSEDQKDDRKSISGISDIGSFFSGLCLVKSYHELSKVLAARSQLYIGRCILSQSKGGELENVSRGSASRIVRTDLQNWVSKQ